MTEPGDPSPRARPEPDAARAALERSWTANADAWTAAVREGRIASRRRGTDAAIVRACERALAEGPGPRVLDAGCGEGWLALALAARGADVLGIDASDALVMRARGAARDRGSPARFAVASYAAMRADAGLARGPFDVVVCNFALLDDEPARSLRALAARLAADGRLLIQTLHPWAYAWETGEPYADGWRLETFASFERPFPMPMPWYFRTLGSWVAAIGEAGLRVAAIEEPLDPATGRPLALLLECRPECRMEPPRAHR